jgi:hypothetical protein
MKRPFALMTVVMLGLTCVALAGNSSSNSSSNSSNGVHTRVDTMVSDDGWGRSVYVRRSVRVDSSRGRSLYEREVFETEPYRPRKMRRWHIVEDRDD